MYIHQNTNKYQKEEEEKEKNPKNASFLAKIPAVHCVPSQK